VQNTTHFLRSLYYMHPARGNTKTGQLASQPRLQRGVRQRCQKTDVPAKTGWMATLPINDHQSTTDAT